MLETPLMRYFSFVLCVIVSCSSPGRGSDPHPPKSPVTEDAAEVSPATSRVVKGVPTMRDPKLIPGDSLKIRVFRQPDLALEIRIPQSGVFSYPLIGEVKAAGQTSIDLERDIRARLAKDYLQDPHVTVTVVEYVARKVYILGGIEKPDRYTLLPTEKITLLQLISAAGGFTDRAHKHRVQIVRRTGKSGREVIRLSLADVERALEKGNAEADLELQPDDLVVIPSGARAVYVLGAVKSPGWFDIPSDTRMTVSMAISRAGSYTKFASTGSIQVLRQTADGESKKFLVDLDEVVNGRLDLDIELEPGDVVWVPERGIF